MVFVPVNLEMVKSLIYQEFPQFRNFFKGDLLDMYEFHQNENKRGLYISIKIPSTKDPGKGIHIILLTNEKLKDGTIKTYKVYSTKKNSYGRYSTGYIRRSEKWKENLYKVISKGIYVYNIKYKKMKEYTIKGCRNTYKYVSNKERVELENYIYFYDFLKSIRKTGQHKTIIYNFTKTHKINIDVDNFNNINNLRKEFIEIFKNRTGKNLEYLIKTT